MKIALKNKLKELAAFAIIGLLFLASSFFSNKYADTIKDFIIVSNEFGLTVYFLIELAAVVVAPISSLPILPLAVSIWGSFWTALISYSAWLIGSLIAFWLARRFGRPLVRRLINIERIEKIEKIEKSINKNNLFIVIVILRIILPVDILSYALGLFSSIRLSTYFIASALGILPFAFIFSYIVTWPLTYQLIIFFLGLIIGWLIIKKAKLLQ